MRVTDSDIERLGHYYPSLKFCVEQREVVGDICFAAQYDSATGQIGVWPGGLAEPIDGPRMIRDAYRVRILYAKQLGYAVGWPVVYETGGRVERILFSQGIDTSDLHVYPDKAFCLGLNVADDPHLSITDFVTRLVVPFLYRLSYVERHGLLAARQDLWQEYSHGIAGRREYVKEVQGVAWQGVGRNALCPCGSGRKYKRCCWDRVRELERRRRVVQSVRLR